MPKLLLYIFSVVFISLPFASQGQNNRYWNNNTQLIPWRMPIPCQPDDYRQEDLDGDGDPDLIYTTIDDSIPVIWIDDDDDMKWNDFEGDTDNDCVLIDCNQDGIFAGPFDLSIDWGDEDGDGVSDIQLIVQNAGGQSLSYFDWDADFMYIIDLDKDCNKHYVDWNALKIKGWEHSGNSNFFEDYSGNSLFLKMHASSYCIDDTRYSWENPFIFYDVDDDGLTEWTVRLVDEPHFRPKTEIESATDKNQGDVAYSKKIDWVGLSWDLDDDNSPGNEFDFDMSLRLTGPGFDYSDQVHKFKTLRGLSDADTLMFDSHWRKVDELIYPDQQKAWDLVFKKGNWSQCWLVFDEDDDCNRWERVEFYEPGNLFKVGRGKGGLDNNAQADAAGDRGEWDTDFSGKGQLYIGAFDGRIHLYGAEKGAWRIDQTACSFQGFGGLYDRWKGGRIQKEPKIFATIKYADTDQDGFFDHLEYDLDGDTVFEEKIDFGELGISESATIINTSAMSYGDFEKLFEEVAEKQFSRSLEAVKLAKKFGINTEWYSFWLNPRTIWEKYEYGYWLNFYLYRDIRQMAVNWKNLALLRELDRCYYSGDYKILLDMEGCDVQ